MLRFAKTSLLAAGICAVSLQAPMAQIGDCSVDAMLVFDGSTSMAEISFETGPNTRIVEARQAIRRAMPDIAPVRRVGLLVYGPGPAGACENLDLKFRPIEQADGPVIAAIDALRPQGLTPLTAGVRAAADVLNYRTDPGVIVLVTDGNETCGGRPCALAADLRATARDLTVHVIGFRAVVDFFAWNNPEQDPTGQNLVAQCFSEETGGLFVRTETVDELVAALRRTLGCPLVG